MNFQVINHYSLYFIICCASLWIGLTTIVFRGKEAPPDINRTLKLVHVIFRHGERNPELSGFASTNPYSDEKYYKEGYGQLTNEGQHTAYNLGVLLRKRYNHFLTDYWNIKYLHAQTSDMARTKMTLELVLAALYPPKDDQFCPLTCWQPIPYIYTSLVQDKMGIPFVPCMRKFNALIADLLKKPELSKYKAEHDQLKSILDSKEMNVEWHLLQIINVYATAHIQEQMGYSLEPWLNAIYPEPFKSAAVNTYYFLTNTTVLKRMMIGYTLKKILDDTAMKINGTIQPAERKMFLYSAHDVNVGAMLLSLKATDISMMPPCGSYVLFEVHEIDGVYGIKLFYSFDKGNDPIAIKLPDCEYFCPFEEFYTLVKEILPQSDEDCLI